MIGPWGAVGPPAAPEYMREVLPRAHPSRELDLMKLAWVAIWILLDKFSLRTIPHVELTTVIDARDAALITQTAAGQPFSPENWRRLAGRWIRWTGRAPVGPPPGEQEVIIPSPWHPGPPLAPTILDRPPVAPRPSSGWVPDAYRRPRQPTTAARRSTLAPPTVEPRRFGITVLLIAAVMAVLLGLGALSLVIGGP
jgi:hypothetical protein